MSLLSKLLGKASPGSDWIEPEDLRSRLRGSSPPLVIDVRGADEFNGPLGHIETARNIPLDGIPTQKADLLAAGRPLVFVCHTDRRSAAAAAQLRLAGAPDVTVVRGGMVAWRSSGRS